MLFRSQGIAQPGRVRSDREQQAGLLAVAREWMAQCQPEGEDRSRDDEPHDRPRDADIEQLPPGRRGVAWVALLLFAVTFTPMPFRI